MSGKRRKPTSSRIGNGAAAPIVRAGAGMGALGLAIAAVLAVPVAAQAATAGGSGTPGPAANELVSTGGNMGRSRDSTIHPGVVTTTGKAQCTANFVYTAAGHTYLGQAAHCSGTGKETDTNGFGDLSTLSLAPQPLSNQVSDLAHELAYARAHSGLKDLQLVVGTERYLPGMVPGLPGRDS